MDEDVISVKEAAERLNISEQAVYAALRRGALRGQTYQKGSRTFYAGVLASSVAAYGGGRTGESSVA